MSYSAEITQKIIRPLRDQYRVARLGPKSFLIDSKVNGQQLNVERNDFILNNPHGHKLQVSHFIIKRNVPAGNPPCVIFIHSNNGSRLQGLQYVESCLQQELELVLFDCSGSGLSDGEFVTLGVREAQDLQVVVNYLVKKGVDKIALWGRSMGAVTALLYSWKSLAPIKACIYDSPFSCLHKLIKQLGKQKTGLPEFFFSFFMSSVQNNLRQTCGIDFQDLRLVDIAHQIAVPAIFITSRRDQMIKDQHCRNLFDKYQAEKHLIYTEQQHHEPRNDDTLKTCVLFLRNKLCSVPKPQMSSSTMSLGRKNSRNGRNTFCFNHLCIKRQIQEEFGLRQTFIPQYQNQEALTEMRSLSRSRSPGEWLDHRFNSRVQHNRKPSNV